VAREAKFRLRLFQQAFVEPTNFFQEFWRPRKLRLRQRRFSRLPGSFTEYKVWGVALVARNGLQLVFGAVEKIMFFAGTMTRKATSGILLGRAIEAKDELLRLRIFRIGALRLQFCIGVRFPWAVTRFATRVGARSGNVRARVDGFRKLFAEDLVTMNASLRSCIPAGIAFDGSLPGNEARFSRGWLLLGEDNRSSCEKPDENNHKEPERLGSQTFSHPQPLFVRAAYCPERHHLLLTPVCLNRLR
jgi:hypothetical protein